MTGTAVVRIIIAAFGVALLLGGLFLALFGGGFAVFGAVFWMIALGAVLIIAAALEITRYRSEQGERARLDPGPGGGESGPLEPRFRRTMETFIDPTSQRLMRVYADPNTGERRYVAEG